MASRYSAGILSTASGTTLLPLSALVGASTIRPHIWEVGVFNTAATACALKLVRMAGAGTPGTPASAIATHVPEDSAPVAAVRGTYTVTPTTLTDAGYRCVLGAVVGSGCIWTFGDNGLIIPAVTAAGVGIVCENGTAPACQTYWVWSE